MLRRRAVFVSAAHHLLDFLSVVPRDVALTSAITLDTHTAPRDDGVIRTNILQNLTRVLQGIG